MPKSINKLKMWSAAALTTAFTIGYHLPAHADRPGWTYYPVCPDKRMSDCYLPNAESRGDNGQTYKNKYTRYRPPPPLPPTPLDRAKSAYKLGISLRDQNRCNEAIRKFKSALRYVANHHQSWAGIGNCYSKMGHYGNAKSAYKRAYQINPHPSYAKMIAFLGERWSSQKGRKEFDLGAQMVNMPALKYGLDAFERAIRHDPTRAEYYIAAAEAAEKMGDLHKARYYVLRARDVDPRNSAYRAHYDGLSIAIKMIAREAAVEKATKMGKLAGSDYSRQYEAEAAFKKAISLDPKNLALRLKYIDFLEDHHMVEAMHAYVDYIELDPGNKEIRSRYVTLLLEAANGQPDDSEGRRRKRDFLAIALDLEPDHPSGWNELASLHLVNRDYDLAIKAQTEAVQRSPMVHHYKETLGEIFVQAASKTDRLSRAPDKVQRRNGYLQEIFTLYGFNGDTTLLPQSSKAWSQIGKALESFSSDIEAERAYRKAVLLSPENRDYAEQYLRLINSRAYDRLKLSNQRKNPARNEFRRSAKYALEDIVEIDPTNVGALTSLGKTNARLQDYDAAKQAYQQVLETKGASGSERLKSHAAMGKIAVQRLFSGKKSPVPLTPPDSDLDAAQKAIIAGETAMEADTLEKAKCLSDQVFARNEMCENSIIDGPAPVLVLEDDYEMSTSQQKAIAEDPNIDQVNSTMATIESLHLETVRRRDDLRAQRQLPNVHDADIQMKLYAVKEELRLLETRWGILKKRRQELIESHL